MPASDSRRARLARAVAPADLSVVSCAFQFRVFGFTDASSQMLARASAPLRAGGARRERLTDALLHEPGALTGHAHQPVELIGAQGLSGLTESPDGEEPLAERNVTVFKGGPDRHRELSPARLAFEDPLADRLRRACLRLQPVGYQRPAVRAHGAIRPSEVFEKRPRGVFIEKLESRGRCAGTATHVCALRQVVFDPVTALEKARARSPARSSRRA